MDNYNALPAVAKALFNHLTVGSFMNPRQKFRKD